MLMKKLFMLFAFCLACALQAQAQLPAITLKDIAGKTIQTDTLARLNGGKPARPDWADIFSSSASVADIFNQAVYSKFDYLCVPLEFRMLLPAAVCEAWIAE